MTASEGDTGQGESGDQERFIDPNTALDTEMMRCEGRK